MAVHENVAKIPNEAVVRQRVEFLQEKLVHLRASIWRKIKRAAAILYDVRVVKVQVACDVNLFGWIALREFLWCQRLELLHFLWPLECNIIPVGLAFHHQKKAIG